MKIGIKANELIDGKIEFISLVKHGANRSPFKIIKNSEQAPLWAGLCPELDILQRRLDAPVTSEKTVKLNDAATAFAKTEQQTEADQIRKQEVAKLRHKLAGLYEQQHNLWERPNTALFQKFDEELNYQIEKTESELRVLSGDAQQAQMDASSAFFRRGGGSGHSDATPSDSAFDRREAAVCKAADQIDLSPQTTQTDETEASKIDLGGFYL